jgi:hypothetical protein
VRLAEKQFKMLYGVDGRKRGQTLQRRSLPAPRRPPAKGHQKGGRKSTTSKKAVKKPGTTTVPAVAQPAS